MLRFLYMALMGIRCGHRSGGECDLEQIRGTDMPLRHVSLSSIVVIVQYSSSVLFFFIFRFAAAALPELAAAVTRSTLAQEQSVGDVA